MNEKIPFNRKQSWPHRFAVAFRGIKIAVHGEATIPVHLCLALIAILAGWTLGISRIEWCIIVLCIGIVLAAELFNTALEHLAQAITEQENAHIRNALDIASGAVLTTALTAATLGTLVLGAHFFE